MGTLNTFPSEALSEGFKQNRSSSRHIVLRCPATHPKIFSRFFVRKHERKNKRILNPAFLWRKFVRKFSSRIHDVYNLTQQTSELHSLHGPATEILIKRRSASFVYGRESRVKETCRPWRMTTRSRCYNLCSPGWIVMLLLWFWNKMVRK